MRILIVFAHPLETSFVSALHARVVEILRAGEHIVDDLDLYAEKFNSAGHVAGGTSSLHQYQRQRHARSRRLRLSACWQPKRSSSCFSRLVRRPTRDHAGVFPARVSARRLRPHRRSRGCSIPICATSNAWPRCAPTAKAAGATSPQRGTRRCVSCADNVGALIDPKGASRFEYLALYDMNFTE